MADRGSIDPVFQQKLNALIAASGGRLKIRNSYRSTETQQRLWQNALRKYGSAAAARKWVAPPGHSKHQEGIAADLSGDLAWAKQNAARFGLWFPLGNEAWHVELQGSRGANGKPTHDGTDIPAPGNPDALDDLGLDDKEQARRGTYEGQIANLLAAISTPTNEMARFQ